MSYLRLRAGRALLLAGIWVLPSGRVKRELLALLDVWSSRVRDELEPAK